MIKFSVLLPTRNRLEFLKYAVETVLKQDYEDWEVIISDNCSEQDIRGYVQSLNDSRIKYYRTKDSVQVTENWNNALEKSTGDYVIMLGDDDGLTKGYFTTISRLIGTYKWPDFIYHNAFLYTYPAVMSGFPNGFLTTHDFPNLFSGKDEPFWFNKEQSLDLVYRSMNFEMSFGYNMQFVIINGQFINQLRNKGSFFKSPYPDHYAMNVIMFKAKRILVYPIPLVIIGISPKSFGYYHFNDLEKQGKEFLRNYPDEKLVQSLKNILLPGTDMNTSWLLAMETIKLHYGSEIEFKVNYNRYRFLQITNVFKKCIIDKKQPISKMHDLWQSMYIWEKLLYGVSLWVFSFFINLIPVRLRIKVTKGLSTFIHRQPKLNMGNKICIYKNILDVFKDINPVND
jgi:glycosyltransferase involved in cell wall biosynthesis